MNPLLPCAPPCDRDLDPDTAHAIAIMLDTYCIWLNKHLASDPYPGMRPYTPTVFLDENPEKGLYGDTWITAMFTSPDHHVIALGTDDGDDGGSTGLTGWWDDYPRWSEPATADTVREVIGREQGLNHMVQEFDTMLTDVLIERELVFHPTYHKEPQ